MSVALLVLAIAMFIGLVIIHELGHYIVAKRNGVQAEEFGIFFPPRLWHRQLRNGTDFSINLIPLGGFVRLKGEHDSDMTAGSFGASSTWSKTKIMTAGVIMNLLAAFVLLTIVAFVGMPQLINNQFNVKSNTHVIENEVLIEQVLNGSPAAKAGLRSGDVITAIGSYGQTIKKVATATSLVTTTKSLASQKVQVDYIANKQAKSAIVTLLSQVVVSASLKTNNPKGYLGIVPTQYNLTRSTWSAPVEAGGLMIQVTSLTFKGLGSALHGLGSIIAGLVTHNKSARQAGQQATDQVTGPIGIFAVLKYGTQLGYQFIVATIGLISLALAIMNILPYPVLDGGKLYLTLMVRSVGRKLSETAEAWIYGTSFVILFLLVILISISDVHRFF